MARRNSIFIGIQGTVVALDPSTGSELWKTPLKGTQFVNVTLHDRAIIAATRGEIFALDPASGEILWNNKLKGLGVGLATIGGGTQVASMASRIQRDKDFVST